jgi:hypothetical protein
MPVVRVLLGLLALAGCAAEPERLPPPYASDRGAYVEFLPFGELEAELDAIADHRIELSVAIQSDDIGTEPLRRMLLGARRRGIPVRAWLLLSDAEGYWPGEDNLPAFEVLVDAFFAWNDDEDLGVYWLSVDLEPPLSISNELAAALEGGDLGQAVPVLLAQVDREEHLAARTAWAAAVDRWHDRDLHVACDAFGYLLDDFADGDPDLQDMFESPIEGIDWDEVGFLVYQILWQDPDGNRLGPALVHSYTQTAVAQFGPRTAIALGTVGSAAKNTTLVGYEQPEAMWADEAAALAAGAPRVHLFSIDGMLGQGGVPRWLGHAPTPVAPEPSPEVQAQRDLIRALD